MEESRLRGARSYCHPVESPDLKHLRPADENKEKGRLVVNEIGE